MSSLFSYKSNLLVLIVSCQFLFHISIKSNSASSLSILSSPPLLNLILISDDLVSNRTKSTLDGLNSSGPIDKLNLINLASSLNDAEMCMKIFEEYSYRIDSNDSKPLKIRSQKIPTFILDIGESSISGKIMARKMGIPSLRVGNLAQCCQDNQAWKNLNQIEKNLFISILNPESIILHLIKDVAEQYKMKSIVVIYDQTFQKAISGFVFKNLKLREIYWPSLMSNETIEQTLNEMRASGTNGENFFILGSIETLNKLIEMAYLRSMLGKNRKWYFISKEKGRFQCELCNNVKVFVSQPTVSHLHHYEHEVHSEQLTNDTVNIVDNYFYYDLARFYLETINEMILNQNTYFFTDDHGDAVYGGNFEGKSSPMSSVNYGQSFPQCGKHLSESQLLERANLQLYEMLSQKFMHGLFGQIIFDKNSNLNYQELNMRINEIQFVKGKIKKVKKFAEWEFEGRFGRLYFTSPQQHDKQEGIPHYDIVTVLDAPFVMEVDDNQTRGNDRFYGYCIDLLKEIVNSSDYKFEYTIRVVDDAMYGNKNENGEWTGMIGELYQKKADIALAPISVMAEREIVVDFTVPFYDLVGITILMKKPTVPSHLFKFLTVLETNVWLCILAAYFFTSFLMYLFDRLSPYSFHNNREKYKDDEEQRVFTLKECLWFCMTSLTPQGGGEAPRNLSGRLVAATWWLFESLDDLYKQYKIKYAPQAGTSTSTYFERMAGIEEKFYEIWKDMSLNDSLTNDERAKLAVWDYPVSDKYTKIWSQIIEAKMPLTFGDAVRRVKNGDQNNEQFAFLTDSTLVKYAVMTNCDLQSVGNEFSRKPIALAVQQNSDLKDKLSSTILKLLNQRRLENLKEKWWNQNEEKKECQDSKKQSDGISINNIGGVFIVIFIGVILACITLVIEYWYFKKKESNVVTISDKNKNQGFAIGNLQPNNHLTPRTNFNTDFGMNQERMLRRLRATKKSFNSFVNNY
ncbi:Glutamate receptor 2 [Sarcoptes scabiei]|uniref:Glutamate receptor 2 n=2 Tax=Sarcoptes scabiei TaxID=52283 RepID=A0A834RBG3_SARSC|nr:Glutamate receptor 2 [Sarcoptes scabiei]